MAEMAKKNDKETVPQRQFQLVGGAKNVPQRASVPADYLKIAKTIRIAVSGDVFLTKLETEIIDTTDFQRLWVIRQLGTVNTVYPTALHTRFDHSLGTLAMAN